MQSTTNPATISATPTNPVSRDTYYRNLCIAALAVIMTCSTGFGVLIGWAAFGDNPPPDPVVIFPVEDQPYCPQEDSCTADYDGEKNEWVIRAERIFTDEG